MNKHLKIILNIFLGIYFYIPLKITNILFAIKTAVSYYRSMDLQGFDFVAYKEFIRAEHDKNEKYANDHKIISVSFLVLISILVYYLVYLFFK